MTDRDPDLDRAVVQAIGQEDDLVVFVENVLEIKLEPWRKELLLALHEGKTRLCSVVNMAGHIPKNAT